MKKSSLIIAFVTLIGAAFSPDSFAFVYSGLVLALIIPLFWRENEPKVLFVYSLFFWLNTSLLLVYGVLTNTSIHDLSLYSPSTIAQANVLAVTALLVYSTGVYLIVARIKIPSTAMIHEIMSRYNSQKIFLVYILASFVQTSIERVFLKYSWGQALLGLIYFKWVVLTFLIIHTIFFKQNRRYVILFITAEIFLSFAGFWASFKDYILVALTAFLTINRELKFRTTALIAIVGGVTFFISVIWTYSKEEYRFYLTGGQRSQQVVRTDPVENINELFKIVNRNFSSQNFNQSFEYGLKALIHRISYIEFFSMSIRQVPAKIPHENGMLLEDAFLHIVQPRFFFPNKKIIDDSEITSKYTGYAFSGIKSGTSFSLGAVPERYIDYGPFFMFVPIFFFGVWIGIMYRSITRFGYNVIWGFCFTAPFFLFYIPLGLPTTKFFGWTVTYFFNFFVLNTFLIPAIDRFLLNKEHQPGQ